MNNKTIEIINIEDDLESLAVRSTLEYLGFNVNLHFIAKSSDLVNLLNGSKHLSPNILIMCHGTDHGIILPELTNEIAKDQPYNQILTPDNLSDFLKLNQSIVVNTGCSTGTQAFAQTFLNNGAQVYIAPNDYPEGSSSLLFVINFYYFLSIKNKSPQESTKLASLIDTDIAMFQYFDK